MCKAYYLFAAMIVGVMVWDGGGRYREGNDAFFDKWNKCCGNFTYDCLKGYGKLNKADVGRFKKICKAPIAGRLAADISKKNWDAL